VNVPPTRPRANGTQTKHDGPDFNDPSWIVRGFGREKQDLDVEFGRADRPGLITDILSACLASPDGSPVATERVWDITVSRRLEYLLRVAMAGRPSVLSLVVECPAEGCGQLLDISLALGDLLARQREAERSDLFEGRAGAAGLQIRRPTGSDQRRWRSSEFENSAEAKREIVRSLVVAGTTAVETLGGDWIHELDPELAAFDPLVAFCVRVACAECGAKNEMPLELEELALRELEKNQARLLRDVHCLAARYHWSEAEVFEVAPERRARYLALIAAEAAA
jgi:hypothetical protein